MISSTILGSTGKEVTSPSWWCWSRLWWPSLCTRVSQSSFTSHIHSAKQTFHYRHTAMSSTHTITLSWTGSNILYIYEYNKINYICEILIMFAAGICKQGLERHHSGMEYSCVSQVRDHMMHVCHAYVCMYMYVHVCMYVYMYMYVCMYVCILCRCLYWRSSQPGELCHCCWFGKAGQL